MWSGGIMVKVLNLWLKRSQVQISAVPLSGNSTHTHTHLMALCPGLPGWAGTRKVKPIWILLKQETVSGSGISWTICKSACRSRQITMPAPHRSVFYRPDALPVTQPTVSKHWRQTDNSLGQFVHTCVPLSPSSIIWWWSGGGDALQLRR